MCHCFVFPDPPPISEEVAATCATMTFWREKKVFSCFRRYATTLECEAAASCGGGSSSGAAVCCLFVAAPLRHLGQSRDGVPQRNVCLSHLRRNLMSSKKKKTVVLAMFEKAKDCLFIKLGSQAKGRSGPESGRSEVR